MRLRRQQHPPGYTACVRDDDHATSPAAPPPTYLGETAPRSRLVGLALTLLMPGLGHVYAGSFVGGLARYLVLFFGFIAFLLAWRAFHFQPHLPSLVLAVGAAAWVVHLLRDVWERTGPGARDYVLQGFNHPVVYGGLLVACHLAPAGLLAHQALGGVVSVVEVADSGLFPMLFIGDRVLVDLTAYRSAAPGAGDLVAVRDPGSRLPLVRRVAAAPGETISFEGRIPVIDLEPSSQEPLGRLSLEGADNHGLPAGLHLEGYTEEGGRRQYTVTYRPDRTHEDRTPERLGAQDLFVLADNRDDGRDSRSFGPVPRTAVLGRPLHVLWSEDPALARVAWTRLGLAAR